MIKLYHSYNLKQCQVNTQNCVLKLVQKVSSYYGYSYFKQLKSLCLFAI